ncbi:MAG: hypothetical protein PHC51_08655 [bacterium]|nr:hypothetical protein [bacterium]
MEQNQQGPRIAVVDNYVFMNCCSDRKTHHPQRAFQAHLLNLKVHNKHEEMVSLALMFIEALSEIRVGRPQHMPAWSSFSLFPRAVMLDRKVIDALREVLADETQPVIYLGKWAGVISVVAKELEDKELLEFRRMFIPVLVEIMLCERFIELYSSDWVHESFVDACARFKPDCHNLEAKYLLKLRKALEFMLNCRAAVKSDNFSARKPALALLNNLETRLEIVESIADDHRIVAAAS